MSKNLIIYAAVSFLFISRASCQLIFRRSLVNCPALKFLQFQQCIMELPRALFTPSSKNKKKSIPKKNSLYFRKRNFLGLILTKFLYFLKRRLFLYVQKWNPALFSPGLKIKKSTPRKTSYTSENFSGLPKKILMFFSKESCSYISENGNLEENLLNIKKPFIFQETELSYIPRKVYSEPQHIQNQKHIQNSGIFRTETYSEHCQSSTMECFAKNSYLAQSLIFSETKLS